jgi:hypothetical protein
MTMMPDIELQLPDGWMRIAEGAPWWQATIIKAAVYQAFFDHYRAIADKYDDALLDERFTEAQREWWAARMTFEAMDYFQSQIEQAMIDAAKLVIFETFNRLASLAVKSSGGGEDDERRAAIARGEIERKAVEFLRRRLETTPFRAGGRKPMIQLSDIFDALRRLPDRAQWADIADEVTRALQQKYKNDDFDASVDTMKKILQRNKLTLKAARARAKKEDK